MLVTPELQSLQHEHSLPVNLSNAESILWKQLMPCLVERCHHSWSHSKGCEYRARDLIPLSTAHGELPLCSCGEGRGLSGDIVCGQYTKLAKFATRVAIPLLFPVPYLEPVLSEAMPGDMVALSRQTSDLRIAKDLNLGIGPAKCDFCGAAKQGLKACVRCGSSKYCNHTCQKMAWKNHKKVCNK